MRSGHRILVAYDAFRPFVYEAVGVDGMLHQHVVVGLFQQFGSGPVGIAFGELLKAGGNTLFFGDAGDAFGEEHDVTAFFQSEFPRRKRLRVEWLQSSWDYRARRSTWYGRSF